LIAPLSLLLPADGGVVGQKAAPQNSSSIGGLLLEDGLLVVEFTLKVLNTKFTIITTKNLAAVLAHFTQRAD